MPYAPQPGQPASVYIPMPAEPVSPETETREAAPASDDTSAKEDK